MVSTEVDRYDDDVDTADVPSAEWGWSKINRRTWYIAGTCMIVFLLLMLHGNHVGKVEDVFLVLFALAGAAVLFRDWWGHRRGWLR